MSRRALALAVVAQLRDTVANGGLNLSVNECGLAPINGMPPAMCGERYVGVRVGSRTTGRVSYGLEEDYTVLVTVSWKINGVVSFDRLGPDLMEASTFGFDAFVDQVRLNLHFDHADGRVANRANATIGYPTADQGGPFAQGMEFMGDDDPAPVGGSWFQCEDGDTPAGIVQNLRFGRIKRVQSFQSSQGVT